MSVPVDRDYLYSQQYANAANLNARVRIHQLFSTNPYGWQRWVFDQLALPESARVLEVGCGPANLFGDNFARIPGGWDITLTDFSPGMLADAALNLGERRPRFKIAAADLQSLPFASDSFDAVIANHMLYHLPDRARGLAEARRVLAPGGRFYATTIGPGHMGEALAGGLARRYGIHVRENPSFGRRIVESFSLANGGEQLAPFFSQYQAALL